MAYNSHLKTRIYGAVPYLQASINKHAKTEDTNERQSLLLSHQSHSISDYARYRNTVAYLRQKSMEVPDSTELMQATGYAKPEKFREHRKEFATLRRSIPLAYLRAIGADPETVLFCGELDMEEFQHVRDTVHLYPEYATIRIHSIIHQSYPFEPGTSEAEAIAILQRIVSERPVRAFINYPAFKTVFVQRDGRVGEVFYPPRLRRTRCSIMVDDDGCKVGKVSLR